MVQLKIDWSSMYVVLIVSYDNINKIFLSICMFYPMSDVQPSFSSVVNRNQMFMKVINKKAVITFFDLC